MSVLARLSQLLGLGPAIEKSSPLDTAESHRAGSLIIIDIRDPDEWTATGTPQGSHRISMTDSDFVETVERLLTTHPNAVTAIGCQTGMRSRTAIKRLRKSIPREFKILQGGIEGWIAAGLPLDY